MKRKKEMISMLQLLPAAMPFPSSSHSKTRYKAWCTLRNHAYENRKKYWDIDSKTLILKTFIICLWNMWKQLLQHELGELKKLKHLAFIISTCITKKIETFSFLAWNIGCLEWNCSGTFLIQVWNIFLAWNIGCLE
jgi:hypothetical protein